MIKLNDIQDNYVGIYSPNGKLIGNTNSELVFNDFRLQIAKERAEGYFFMYDGIKYTIRSDGKVDNWPCKLFDTCMNQMEELFRIQLKIKDEQRNKE